MKFADLMPRWLEHEGKRVAIMFLCPHCYPKSAQWLSVFFVPAGELPRIVSDDEDMNGERWERAAFEEALRNLGVSDPRRAAWDVVSCRPDQSWKRSSDDFESMSITPSIDASPSGHWHGFVKKGKIR